MFKSMVVISMKADDKVHMWFGYTSDIELEIIDNALYRDGKSIINDLSLVDIGFYKYQDIPPKYEGDEGEEELVPWYLHELNLQSIDADDLPFSEHIGVLKAVNPANARPAIVTRKFMGQEFDVNCLATQNVVNLWQSGQLAVGDYVIVSFIDEIPNTVERHIAIVTDKVYRSW
jgi:hypothetical protein